MCVIQLNDQHSRIRDGLLRARTAISTWPSKSPGHLQSFPRGVPALKHQSKSPWAYSPQTLDTSRILKIQNISVIYNPNRKI